MKRFMEKAGYPLVLLVSGLLVFGVVAAFGHISIDDPAYVFNNPYLSNPLSGHIIKLLFKPYANMVRPLDSLVYLAEFRLWGFSPAGYHLVNLLLHITNSILVFVMLGYFIKERSYRFLAALIFLLHPVQAETAAWISEQKSTLSTLFLLLAMTAYIRFRQEHWRTGLLLTFLCFVAGLLVKPNIVIFPVLLVWYDFLYTDQSLVKNIAEKYYFWLLSLATGVLYLHFVHKTGFTTASGGGSLHTQVLTTITTFAGIAQYPLAIVFPFYIHLVAYPDHPVTRVLSPQFLSSAFLLMTIFLLTYAAYRKGHKTLVFFIGWYYLNFMFASGLIPMAYQGAARYLYIPLIGPAVVFVLGIRWLARSLPSEGMPGVSGQEGIRGRTAWGSILARAGIAGALILMLGSFVAIDRVSIRAWRDDLTFWKYQVWSQPENGRDRAFLADTLAGNHDIVAAEDQARMAAALSPDDPVVWSRIFSVYYSAGMYDAAQSTLEHLHSVLLQNYGPVDPEEIPDSGTGYDVRNYYFLLYSSSADLSYRTSRFAAAVQFGTRALALQPGNEHVFALTADSLLQEHKPGDVLRLARAFIRLQPGAWTGYLMEALAFEQMSDPQDALPAFDEAIARCRNSQRRQYMILKRQEMSDRLKHP